MAKKQKNSRHSPHYTTSPKQVIIIVIILAMLTIITGALLAVFSNTEANVKSRISAIASDYYENYFYQNLISSPKYQQLTNLDKAMEKYHRRGLAPLSLGDLLLTGDRKNAKYTDYLTKYCDRNHTIIKFYPDPPYDRTSYHTDITYSCNF